MIPPPPRRMPLATRLAVVAGLALAGLLSIAALRHWQGPRGSAAALPYVGVNLAGGEFAPDDRQAVYGRHYVYPDAAVAAPFLDRGMTAVRLPIRWERIQPWPQAMLSPAETKRLDAAIAALDGFAMILIDLHNFAEYHGRRLGADPRSAALLADVWRRLAERYAGDPRIAFGLMNEPVGIAPRDWRVLADAAVAAIRATGAGNLILVPGSEWTGAHSWDRGGDASNASAMAGFADGNFAFELHQYLDAGSAGTSPECVDPAVVVERVAGVTRWLRLQHARGFLGEFGAGPSRRCRAGLEALLAHLEDNRDVWLGWTYWAAGPWWGGHWMAVQPPAKGDAPPQLTLLARHVPTPR